MPTIPWLPGPEKEGGASSGPPLVMASRLELRSLRTVPRFLWLSLLIFQQVRRAPGLIGVSLRAQPLKRTFWTLSAWRDQEALDAFSRADPHAKSVRGIRPAMGGTVFAFWSTERDRLPVGWDEAGRRLDEQAAKDAKKEQAT